MTARLSDPQIEALAHACTSDGGWPRAKANDRSWAIRSYRALERLGLVVEVEERLVRGDLRIRFLASDAGHEANYAILKAEGAI